MNIHNFKAQANNARNEEEVDELCLQWLLDKAKEYGKEGRAAELLLRAYEVLTS